MHDTINLHQSGWSEEGADNYTESHHIYTFSKEKKLFTTFAFNHPLSPILKYIYISHLETTHMCTPFSRGMIYAFLINTWSSVRLCISPLDNCGALSLKSENRGIGRDWVLNKN